MMLPFDDFVPPVYRHTVIETGISPTLILREIADICQGSETPR